MVGIATVEKNRLFFAQVARGGGTSPAPRKWAKHTGWFAPPMDSGVCDDDDSSGRGRRLQHLFRLTIFEPFRAKHDCGWSTGATKDKRMA